MKGRVKENITNIFLELTLPSHDISKSGNPHMKFSESSNFVIHMETLKLRKENSSGSPYIIHIYVNISG